MLTTFLWFSFLFILLLQFISIGLLSNRVRARFFYSNCVFVHVFFLQQIRFRTRLGEQLLTIFKNLNLKIR